ncbi:MAG: hypothetical protein ACP5KN_15465 [Armatimonadota bacterium]
MFDGFHALDGALLRLVTERSSETIEIGPGDVVQDRIVLLAPNVASEGGRFVPVSSRLGSALVRLTEDEIVIDRRRLKLIYEASAPPEKKKRDKGASGSVKTDFPVDINEYEEGRYGDG